MAEIKFNRWKFGLPLALALAFMGFAPRNSKADSIPHRADNQNFSQQSQPQSVNISPVIFNRPPLSPRGAPGSKQGGGGRNGNTCAAWEIEENLLALVPSVEPEPKISHVWGWTVAVSPTLWFYAPYLPQDIKAGELELWDETDAAVKNHKRIYHGTFRVSNTPGAIALSLPSTVTLEPDKNYHWYLSLEINCKGVNPTVNVDGWIQRIKLNNNLTPPPRLSERERVIWYAKNGIWHDALTLVAQLRRRYPQNKNFLSDWQKLLKDVGLEEVADKPIAPCCQLQRSRE